MAEDDEVTGLAGWLYTDLLLGLAVVFLGAISFTVIKPVVTDDGDGSVVAASSTSSTSTTTTTTIPQPCTIHDPGDNQDAYRFRVNFGGDVAAQVATELGRLQEINGLPKGSRVAFAIAYGWGSNAAEGEGNAERKWKQLQDELPEVFGEATARYIWGTRLQYNQVNLDVFLQTGGCN